MHKNIVYLSVGIVVWGGGLPAIAQMAGSAPATAASSKLQTIEVKDYKSFLEYNKKHAIIRAGDLGEIQLDKNEMRFPNKKTKAFKNHTDGARDEFGALSVDKRKVSVFNRRDRSFKIFDNSGKELRKTILSRFPAGVNFIFSDTKIFAISPTMDGPGGFEAFTSTGGYIKWFDVGDIQGFKVSATQKYFMLTAGKSQTGDFFIIFDMAGNELWKHPIVPGWDALIEFSPDDRFVSVKLPRYWIKAKETDPYATVRKTNKLYVIDIDNRRIVSEEDYVN